ncbi:sulfatase-like hydrolase/transferase [Siccirubricoccus sp. G192]|uniref:sulfatase-like hydrolase/transferase n=1 Tax=Siccirubricoccus sp. G192 TaxID=2849651 RepID=UPI001C2C9F62|nr:sulfatase-like hydrolase/transferase [Siccirubricoccus sp. G192]MBV1796587.1 sulfatase-like hydrolase/transferase [Siccirubricoccus sp. G192]
MAEESSASGPGRIGLSYRDSTPSWRAPPQAPEGAPNILLVLFDDAGFSDFGCFGSPVRTPTIDRMAAEGLRYTGFHTTAMCSTTRTALLTGRNHHSAGVGSLANFDSGYPGYRGKIAREAGTLAEMLRPHGYRNYMVGKWHVTPLTESGSTGPFDGWPLARGFDRYYGFMDAATDQYTPELVRDNSTIEPPRTPAEGYHLTEDLVDQSIRFLAGHAAERPGEPWLLWLALGAVHAPHQAPADIIRSYDSVFRDGWDAERERRLARQKAMGIVPPGTALPPRNDDVRPWSDYGPEQQRYFTRLQSAFAGMLDHADRHLARLIGFLEQAGLREDTLVLVLSDNGGSQEGGPLGGVNLLGPRNLREEPMAEKLARLEDIGSPGTYANYPLGWAMASNTPLRRYKQNTHGGGIRDPLVISWPKGIAARGELRHQFVHASDLAPTLLDLVGVAPPEQVNGVPQMPLEGTSFAASLGDPAAPSKATPQYFEMFGHRGIVHQGWKAVAYHPPETPFEDDRWELFHLDTDFSESNDLATREPARLAELVALWWREAEKHQVLPLDDRFRQRFIENAARFHGARRRYVFHAGVGHVPTEVAPDIRSRSYRIEAHAEFDAAANGVLIAHGDATTGYSLYLRDGHLVHDMNIGSEHVIVTSDHPVPPGRHVAGLRVRRLSREPKPSLATGPGISEFTLLIDGLPAGRIESRLGFYNFVSWAGLDIGCDRGSPVSRYDAPFMFSGSLIKVVVTMDDDQVLDGDGIGRAVMARE